MTLDEMIQESIESWEPLKFTRDDLDKKRFKIVWWTSLEVENEINKLSDKGYVPIGWISCSYTSHWLVYAVLMENLYYNYNPNETFMDNESNWEEGIRNTYWEWETPDTWWDKGDDWLESVLA